MKRFAYLGSSKKGGTYRVYETLADGLAHYGWSGDFVGEQSLGAGWEGLPDVEVARQLRELLCGYDAVIGNVFIGTRLMNILRYLPPDLPRILVVHNITYATYRAASALQDFVHHVVCVSPRIRSDLIQRYGFKPERVSTILNAVSNEFFDVPLSRQEDGPPSILSLGRLDDRAKRVSLIPQIVAGCPSASYRLTIAGDGPDRVKVESSLVRHSVRADLPGRIDRSRLTEVYGTHSVFLFPSRYEGMGLALAEAMAAGLAPIAARIPGVTSAFIEDGVSGHLFDQGDLSTAQRRLARFLKDPARLLATRVAARGHAEKLFRAHMMHEAYANILARACTRPVALREYSLTTWSIPMAMRPGLRSLLPSQLRRRLADMMFFR